MIDYELAKELKEVGYPITFNHPKWLLNKPWEESEVTSENEHYGYDLPDLSELIDACGDEVALTNLKGYLDSKGVTEKWLATKSHGFEKSEDMAQGKTHEEAVARLYLATHRK